MVGDPGGGCHPQADSRRTRHPADQAHPSQQLFGEHRRDRTMGRLRNSGRASRLPRACSRGRFPARRGPHSTKLPVTQAVTWTIRQSPWRRPTMRIGLTVVYVDDQDQAEWFYSDVLGMRIKTNAPYGSGRWLTVVSLEDPDGVELVLYLADDAARDFQQASRELGRPAFSLRTDDCLRDSTQLKAKGVVFVTEPAWRDYGGMDAVFDDT